MEILYIYMIIFIFSLFANKYPIPIQHPNNLIVITHVYYYYHSDNIHKILEHHSYRPHNH